MTWSYLGTTTSHVLSLAVTFPSDGCYTVGLTALHADGSRLTAAKSVAVGDAICP